eukprot:6201149-Pleurochrysis_carterae.AAC.1
MGKASATARARREPRSRFGGARSRHSRYVSRSGCVRSDSGTCVLRVNETCIFAALYIAARAVFDTTSSE